GTRPAAPSRTAKKRCLATMRASVRPSCSERFPWRVRSSFAWRTTATSNGRTASRRAVDVGEAYRRHGHSVMRRARVLLGDDQDAQEVLQEIFLTLAQQPDAFAGRASLSTYLYSMTTHRCLNRL